jgi:hypothetical protein
MRVRSAAVGVLVLCLVIGAAAQGNRASRPVARLQVHLTRVRPLRRAPAWALRDPVLARLGLPPVPTGSRLPGYLMIADRDNNRIIIVSPSRRIVWRFPPPRVGAGGFLSEPDDAFVSADGRYISTNQEFNETIRVITLNRHPRIVWSYGHPASAGSVAGYLSHPDDAYLLSNHLVQVADIINCRILWLDRRGRIVRAVGRAGNCTHDPPRSLADPNGDTPTPDGGVLVTEIGGWVDRLGARGRLLWSIRTPTDYPSDAQLLPNGDVLVASYTSPGRVDIITPRGRVVWTYEFLSGRRALDHPSLAVPFGGHLMVLNDDFNDRVLVIDRRTKAIVWSYGHDGVPGSRTGYLNKPDGLQLLP